MTTRYDGISISTGFLAGNLFDGWGGAERINVPMSAATYAQKVEDALTEEFPGAIINLSYQVNTSGSLPFPLKTRVDGVANWHEEMDIIEQISDCCSRVYADSDSWVVYLPAK